MYNLEMLQILGFNWLRRCFSETIVYDTKERCIRFLEESLELVQSLGLTETEAQRIVNYVYGRKKGEVEQEVAGTLHTLLVLCEVQQINPEAALLAEYKRIEEIIDVIRNKHALKPNLRDIPLNEESPHPKVDSDVSKTTELNTNDD